MCDPELIFLEKPDNSVRVTLTSIGAAVFSLEFRDANGEWIDLALTCDTLEEFMKNDVALGATCGRVANRISGAQFELEGVQHKLAANNGANSLHGGDAPFHLRNWRVGEKQVLESGSISQCFHLTSPDQDGGYPGELEVTARYTLSAETLTLEYTAQAQAPTVINLTNHVYWNLSGDLNSSIDDHKLLVPASRFLPTDRTSMVTGEICDVDGRIFDMRSGILIGDRLKSRDTQLDERQGFDHALCVDGDGYRLGACLEHPPSGRRLELYTDQAAVHVYTGAFLNNAASGKKGSVIKPFSGVALESENYPDAPNQPHFPSCLLLPGEVYTHTIAWKFSQS